MEDRELLEMAAKACNMDLPHWVDQNNDEDSAHYGEPCLCGDLAGKPYEVDSWNPLTDDGDALRLAVKLGFTISTEEEAVIMCDRLPTIIVVKHHGEDCYSAVRHAIVRAAAEIGRSMP